MVILRAEPDRYERQRARWLAKLATEGRDVGLGGLAQAAVALEALPREPGARAVLAEVCRDAGEPEAARVSPRTGSRFTQAAVVTKKLIAARVTLSGDTGHCR